MQLHRNNTSNLIDFSREMEKIAGKSVRDLYLKDREERAFNAFKATTDPYSGAKAFAKGFGASFALPLALGLATTQPQKLVEQMNAVTKNYLQTEYVKKGLMEGGVSRAEANRVAPYLNQRLNIAEKVPSRVSLTVEKAIKENLKKDILGPGNMVNSTHRWAGPANNPIKQLPLNASGYEKIKKIMGNQSEVLLDATVDDIYKSMPLKANTEGSLRRLSDIGEAAFRREGRDLVPVARSKGRKVLTSMLKSRAKAGVIIGGVGGVTNFISNYKERKRYKDYEKKVKGVLDVRR